MNSFKQYLTIILSTFLVGAIIYTPLSSYLTYIVGFLIVLSLTYIFAKRKQNIAETFSNSFVFIFVALIGTLLIIFLTGGIASPLFFLLYFLIFATPFMFEPFAVVIFFIGLMALFIVPAFENDVFSNMVRIGSMNLRNINLYFHIALESQYRECYLSLVCLPTRFNYYHTGSRLISIVLGGKGRYCYHSLASLI